MKLSDYRISTLSLSGIEVAEGTDALLDKLVPDIQ